MRFSFVTDRVMMGEAKARCCAFGGLVGGLNQEPEGGGVVLVGQESSKISDNR